MKSTPTFIHYPGHFSIFLLVGATHALWSSSSEIPTSYDLTYHVSVGGCLGCDKQLLLGSFLGH